MSTFRNRRFAMVIILVSVVAFAGGYLVKGAIGPIADEAVHAPVTEDHDLEAHLDDDGNITWTCSMHPQIQLPEPGKCPICFMELIPLRRTEEGGRDSLREISLSENARKLAGIATEAVRRLDVAVETRMLGKVDYDETRVRTITAWAGGRVDKMYVDYTGDTVRRGQPMVSVYSPELLTAQAELIQAVKAMRDLKNSNLDLVRDSAARTEDAAREKLRLLGLTKAQIDRVAAEGKASDHITLYAPQGGVVIRKDVNEGQYVKTGAPIYAIADLSSLWVVLEAYESDLPWVSLGQEVEFRTEAYPGKVFKGKVVYIDPLVNEKTRTVRVRLVVPNKDGSLKPGMLVRATQHKDKTAAKGGESPLVIPASAPLITGKRAVVYVAVPDKAGAYEGREIVLGAKAGNFYIVKSGLTEGEQVVTKGNFKIDSAVQIVAKPSMMNPSSAVEGGDDGELPSLFASQLRLLAQSFGELSDAVATRDLSRTHLAFGRFDKALRLIDGSGLEGDSSLRWKESAMLLGNDAILGAEAPDVARLNEIFAEMKGHYGEMAAAFKVAPAPAGPSVPAAFRRQLGQVFAAYEPLAKALATDDAEGARQAASKVSEALRLVDGQVLDGPSHTLWSEALEDMTGGLEAIRQADGIDAVRTGFKPLSAGLSDALLKFGSDTDGPLYEIFCPMAFDYEGATWVQRDQEVNNPYFGTAMSTCGEINKQLKR
ncbi:Cation efflux system protein CusB precursor [Pseudodesulfovibrio hydrargyri]|uniref:Cation efflux system protein CusB n=1 Tax=Pseudodesulfovibrio hydrargyri TaxID=2125990 RepID=A0A1J5N9A8_9BACT|nr:efflux RND transporter periplasmic adaptor subunit [Pseudodesulfovibrio hydrargyri]OIQ51400.1 Cation efflux system protein CusB precursor [Pseudodesulfovibrio hydrargyri]